MLTVKLFFTEVVDQMKMKDRLSKSTFKVSSKRLLHDDLLLIEIKKVERVIHHCPIEQITLYSPDNLRQFSFNTMDAEIDFVAVGTDS